MRIFIAGLATETNTFSPMPTGASAFRLGSPELRDATRRPPQSGSVPLHAWRERAEADGHEVIESICAAAQPAGLTVRAIYEALRDEILADLKAAAPVDVVLLALHGAMVADGYDDCEGDIIARARAIVGPDVPIGVELDLHCHLTEKRVAEATVIVLYKEYPHTDIRERAMEVYDLATGAAAGRIRPVMALHDCRMIGTWRTSESPIREFVDRMSALEGKDGILSVSFGHGFPRADVPEVGARMLVIADGDRTRAAALAARLAREVWDTREAATAKYLTLDAALDLVPASGKPLVIADASDNPGGGAPGDSTFILRRMLERGIAPAAVGAFWDPGAVALCREAGAGARLALRVGGKLGPGSGDPLDLDAEVLAVSDDHVETGLAGGRARLGPSARIRAGGIEIVLITIRAQVFHPDLFTGLGMDLSGMRVVVVKSSQHFYAAFAPLASRVVYATTPGTLRQDLARAPLNRRTVPWWPRVEDPFAA